MLLLSSLGISLASAWPFAEPKVQPLNVRLPPGLPPGLMPLGRGPVIVVESHMGFNPWEDLHKNLERVVRGQGQGQGQGPGAQGGLAPLQMQLGGLLDIFGDHHAGHHGLAQGSFEVHDDHQSRVLITAILPDYEAFFFFSFQRAVCGQFGAKTSEKPLSVRAVGRLLHLKRGLILEITVFRMRSLTAI